MSEFLSTLAQASLDIILRILGVIVVLVVGLRLGKYLSKKFKEAKANEIKALMGNSSKGTDGNYKVSWSNSSKPTFDAKRFALENPGIDLKPYYKHSFFRTFKVTEAGR